MRTVLLSSQKYYTEPTLQPLRYCSFPTFPNLTERSFERCTPLCGHHLRVHLRLSCRPHHRQWLPPKEEHSPPLPWTRLRGSGHHFGPSGIHNLQLGPMHHCPLGRVRVQVSAVCRTLQPRLRYRTKILRNGKCRWF